MSDASAPDGGPNRTQHWSVAVERDGESVVTIASNCLSGRDLGEEDEHVIRLAAQHLLSFVGQPPVPASRGEGWQPIETAPKDEQRVVLFNPDEGTYCWAIQTGAHYEQLGGWQYDGQNPRYSNAHQPTHWMPLPTPPSPPRER